MKGLSPSMALCTIPLIVFDEMCLFRWCALMRGRAEKTSSNFTPQLSKFKKSPANSSKCYLLRLKSLVMQHERDDCCTSQGIPARYHLNSSSSSTIYFVQHSPRYFPAGGWFKWKNAHQDWLGCPKQWHTVALLKRSSQGDEGSEGTVCIYLKMGTTKPNCSFMHHCLRYKGIVLAQKVGNCFVKLFFRCEV